MNPAVLAGDALVISTCLELWVFVGLYHELSRRAGVPWWSDPGGCLTMALAASEAVVLSLSTARTLAGASLDTPWFTWVRITMFGTLPVVIGGCVYALWRLYHPRATGRHGALAVPGDEAQ